MQRLFASLSEQDKRRNAGIAAVKLGHGGIDTIARLKDTYLRAGDPVFSIDPQKKELLGDFARDGYTYTQVPVDTLDYDFPTPAASTIPKRAGCLSSAMAAPVMLPIPMC